MLLKTIRQSRISELHADANQIEPITPESSRLEVQHLEQKLASLRQHQPYPNLSVARLQEQLRLLQSHSPNWINLLSSGKFGTLYRANQYQPEHRGDFSVNWGYPRQDSFPLVILYPIGGRLTNLVATLESIFPPSVQTHICSDRPPVANVCVSPILYVGYGDSEARLQAIATQQPGWQQTNYSQQQYQKCPTYLEPETCRHHRHYCEWQDSLGCQSLPLPIESTYQKKTTDPETL